MDAAQSARELAWRLVAEDRGQDLIEYGLLASIIGVAGLLLFPTIATKMGTAFSNWGSCVYSVWIPADAGVTPTACP